MKLCILSDSHGLHDQVKVEPSDVLIHCGDCTNDAGQAALRNFLVWLERQPAKDKILIAGNHDWAFEKWPDLAQAMVKEFAPSVHYLQDSGVEIDGVKFWGSPMTPSFYGWAFNRDRGDAIKRHWDLIPEGTDVLVTHGPPKGFLDYNKYDKFHCGCEDLLNAITQLSPKLHCFGHIHQGHGAQEIDDGVLETMLINASVVNEKYMVTYLPTYYDLTT